MCLRNPVNPCFALLYRFFVPFAPHFVAWAFFFRGSKAIEARIEKPSVFGKRFPKSVLASIREISLIKLVRRLSSINPVTPGAEMGV